MTVRFLVEHGMIAQRDFVGIKATSVQHQIYHPNCKMHSDHLSDVKWAVCSAKQKRCPHESYFYGHFPVLYRLF